MAETLEIDYKPQPKQLLLSECPANEILFGGSAGPGKVVCDDAKVLTPWGWREGRHLRVGDIICGADGLNQRIVAISEKIVGPGWVVRFEDDCFTTVMSGHLWSIAYDGKHEIVSTKELRSIVLKNRSPSIPLCGEVHFYTPPTQYGYTGQIGLLEAYYFGQKFSEIDKKNRGTTENFGKIKKLWEAVGLPRSNAYNSFFVPDDIVFGSIGVRRGFIWGLLDEGGLIHPDEGYVSLFVSNLKVARGIASIIRSLGGIVKINIRRKKKDKKPSYMLHIRHESPAILFSRSSRQLSRILPEREIRRKISEVIETENIVTGRCITVSNPDGLYITDDFIVTHNSHAIRYEALIWAMRIPKLQVYLFRRIYPELERNHILPILMEWGNKYGEYSDRKRRYVLSNGSIIHFCHAQYEQDIMGYHGAEIHLLVVDELSTFTEFQYTYLRNRVRCALEIPEQYIGKVPGIICGSNPGGPGHEFCKSMFVDFCIIDTEEAVKRMREPELYGPVYEHPHRRLGHTIYYGLRKAPDEEGGMVRAYIPALLEDNPILMERDPGYINRVKAMPEPYRSAYLDGDWEIFVGQMFNFSRKHHVCPKHEVPAHAPIYFGFDWGFGKPFSCNWLYTDADGRLYLFSEWYGFTGVPDTGLRMSDSQIAEGIIKHEKLIGLRTETGGMVVNGFDCGVPIRPVEYILSPDCFSRKPSYMGGGQGPSTDEVFAMYGINGYPGDATRNQKIKQFHERLRVPENGDRPMFQVFETCPQFIRTIPQLQQSQTDPEDVDGKAEDHIYDAVSLVFMARPVELKMPNEKLSPTDLRLERLKAMGGDPYEDYAGYHAGVEMELLDGEDFGDDLVDTVF